MNKKDVAMIKKIISSPEYTPVIRCASCYVDVDKKDVFFQDTKLFLNMDEDQLLRYLSFMRKGLSGKPGNTVIEIKPVENALEPLWRTKLQDVDEIHKVAEIIMDAYRTDNNYSLFFAYGEYDLPDKNRDSEEVYRFVLTLIQPCPLSKPGIRYDRPKNEFTNRSLDRLVNDPNIAILFPSIDDGHTNIDHAAIYAKNAKQMAGVKDLSLSLFDTSIPLSAKEQQQGFQDLLKASFDNELPYNAVKGVYDILAEKKSDMDISGNDVTFTEKELAEIIIEGGKLEKRSDEIFELSKQYSGYRFSISNLVPEKVNIETSSASIRADLVDMFTIEKRVIDGKEYYLIPARNSSVDGLVMASDK